MKSFRSRNPVAIGAVGLATTLALLTVTFNLDKIPLFGAGDAYSAAFSEASGVKAGDEVRIAGVKVGSVTKVDLDGDHVKVDFAVDPAVRFGTRTAATIKVRTILGQKFVALLPAGDDTMAPGAEIPITRTAPAFDIVSVFTDLGGTVQAIDTDQLAKSFTVLADAFRDSPENVRASLDGLSRLSRTISSRDAQIGELLTNAQGVTKVLADRNGEFQKLVADGDLLLKEVQRRRDVIHELLVNTQTLGVQISGLVSDNKARLTPALEELKQTVDILKKNEQNLADGIALLAPFVRVFSNALGTGRWFDTYIVNLASPTTLPIVGGTS